MRRLLLLACLALVPLAHAATPPDYAEARSLLAIAREHEQRALELTLKKPPRRQAAVLRLTQSMETLDKLRVVVTAESLGSEVLSREDYLLRVRLLECP